jgi:hypothetical protein
MSMIEFKLAGSKHIILEALDVQFSGRNSGVDENARVEWALKRAVPEYVRLSLDLKISYPYQTAVAKPL